MPFPPRPSTSLEYVSCAVSGKVAGELVDVSLDTVAFAFTQGSDDPSTFYAGSWEVDETTTPTTYTALCLVGPGGAVTLTAGNWSVWVKVTDNPEVPILQVPGLLTIL